MKRFFQCVIAAALVSLAMNVVAGPSTPYYTKLEPISTAKRVSLFGYGPSTDIVVINFTDSTILLNSPTYNVITPKTSARVKNDDWNGDTEIRLTNNYGQVFFDRYVGNHATVSVYVTNGQYTINVTN